MTSQQWYFPPTRIFRTSTLKKSIQVKPPTFKERTSLMLLYADPVYLITSYIIIYI